MVAATEIDLRLFGMLVALAAILLTFSILSGGKFFQPANMVTLAVQATGVAIIATGMVLVIVSRNIDLSVGSLVGRHRHDLRATDDRHPARRRGLARRFPVPLGHRPRASASPWAPPSVRCRASSSPTSACPRSSSHWAGCSHCAASSGSSPTAPRSRAGPGLPADRGRGGRLDRGSRDLGRRHHRLRGDHRLAHNSRRQRRRFGFPVRPIWAEVLLGCVRLPRRPRCGRDRQRELWPEGLANRIATEQNWDPAPAGGWRSRPGFP